MQQRGMVAGGEWEDESEDGEVPYDAMCKICAGMMRDPVTTQQGFSYCRQCIEQWFAVSNLDPSTNQRVHHKGLVPNHNLRQLVETLQEEREKARQSERAQESASRARSAPLPLVVLVVAALAALVATFRGRAESRQGRSSGCGKGVELWLTQAGIQREAGESCESSFQRAMREARGSVSFMRESPGALCEAIASTCESAFPSLSTKKEAALTLVAGIERVDRACGEAAASSGALRLIEANDLSSSMPEQHANLVGALAPFSPTRRFAASAVESLVKLSAETNPRASATAAMSLERAAQRSREMAEALGKSSRALAGLATRAESSSEDAAAALVEVWKAFDRRLLSEEVRRAGVALATSRDLAARFSGDESAQSFAAASIARAERGDARRVACRIAEFFAERGEESAFALLVAAHLVQDKAGKRALTGRHCAPVVARELAKAIGRWGCEREAALRLAALIGPGEARPALEVIARAAPNGSTCQALARQALGSGATYGTGERRSHSRLFLPL